MGAWPKSLLTAIRMRNLEALANRPPEASINLQNVEALRQSPHQAAYNERPLKAFMAGYRNLGGGIKKDTGGSDQDELALSFTLTELSPLSNVSTDGASLSSLLIPSQANLLGTQYDRKYYLDLHILPVNYLIYYTTFIGKSKDINYAGAGTDDAGCDNVKTALPVPSYIMGFIKNPNILTYYSVKAEAKFIGLFFPFYRTLGDGIQLKAYASAKPFGGRIGPKFFEEEFGALKSRSGNLEELKSAAYLIGIDNAGSSLTGGGYPLPPNTQADFYLNDKNQSIGGPTNTGQSVVYAIPNMIYDFKNNLDEIITSPGNERFLKLRPAAAFATAPSRPTSPPPQEERIGLYDWNQFDLFYQRTLGAALGTGPAAGTITTPQLLKAIQNALKPTLYEAVNWMIPLETTSSNDMAAPTTVVNPEGTVDDSYWLYAPLYGPGTLYNESAAIGSVVKSYLSDNRLSFDKYLNALKKAADEDSCPRFR